MRNRKTITISELEYEQLQAEAALMWEMTNDYGKQRGDGTWEHPFWDVITRLHPYSAQRVIDADLAIQEVEECDARRKFNMRDARGNDMRYAVHTISEDRGSEFHA